MTKLTFETLHAEEQLELACTAIGWFGTHKCPTIERLADEREESVLEFWRDICAEAGLDECEPWKSYPAPPTKENWNWPERDRELPPEWQARYAQVQKIRASLGRHRH